MFDRAKYAEISGLILAFVEQYQTKRFGGVPHLSSHHPFFKWMCQKRDYLEAYHLAYSNAIADLCQRSPGLFVCAIGAVASEMGYQVQYLIANARPVLRIDGLYFDPFYFSGIAHISDLYDCGNESTILTVDAKTIFTDHTCLVDTDHSIIQWFVQSRTGRNFQYLE